MNELKVQAVLRLLGCHKIKTRPNGFVVGSCPFAPFRHQNGSDMAPSFGIKVNDCGSSHFHCYTCRLSGDMTTLVNMLRWKYKDVGVDLTELGRLIANDDIETPDSLASRLASIEDKPKPIEIAGMKLSSSTAQSYGIDAASLEYLPETTLDPFRAFPINAWMYLKGPKRKFTEETILAWELGWYEEEQRIIIPIRDCTGRLVGYSRRLLEDEWVFDFERNKHLPFAGRKRPPKYLHSDGFKRDLVLYGEHMLKKESRTGYLVEGFFDVIYLWQLGYYNAVAIMGTHLSPLQEHKILQFFDRLIVFRDGDEAGKGASDKIVKKLSEKIIVTATDTPPSKDPNSLNPNEIRGLVENQNNPFEGLTT